MPLPGSYTINFTDPLKGSFVINPNKADGPIDPTRNQVSQVPTNAISSTLLLYGRGVPNYGHSVAENLVHLLENFAGPIEPVQPTHGQIWYDTGARSTILATDTNNDTLTVAGDVRVYFPINTPFHVITIVNQTSNDEYNITNWTVHNSVAPTFNGTNTVIKTLQNIPNQLTGSSVSVSITNQRLKIFHDPSFDGSGDWISISPTAFVGSGPLTGDTPSYGDMWFDNDTDPTSPTLKIYDGVDWVDLLEPYLKKTGGTITGPLILSSTLSVGGTATFNGPTNHNDPVVFNDTTTFNNPAEFNDDATFDGPSVFNDPVTFFDAIVINSTATYNDAVTFNFSVASNGTFTFDGPIIINGTIDALSGILDVTNNQIDNVNSPAFVGSPLVGNLQKAVNVEHVRDAVLYAINDLSSSGLWVSTTGDQMTGDLQWSSATELGISWYIGVNTAYKAFSIHTGPDLGSPVLTNLIFDAPGASAEEGFIFVHPQSLQPTLLEIYPEYITTTVPLNLPSTNPATDYQAAHKKYVDDSIAAIPVPDDTRVSVLQYNNATNDLVLTQIGQYASTVTANLDELVTAGAITTYVPQTTTIDDVTVLAGTPETNVSTALDVLDSSKAKQTNAMMGGYVRIDHSYPIYAIPNLATDHSIDIDILSYPLAEAEFRNGHIIKLVPPSGNEYEANLYRVVSKTIIVGSPLLMRLQLANLDLSTAALTPNSSAVGHQYIELFNPGTDTLSTATGVTQVVFENSDIAYGNRPTITLTGDTWQAGAISSSIITVTGSSLNNGTYTVYARESSTVVSLINTNTLVDETDSGPVGTVITVLEADPGSVATTTLLDTPTGLFGGASANYRIWLEIDGSIDNYTCLGNANVTYGNLITAIDDANVNLSLSSADPNIPANDMLLFQSTTTGTGSDILIRDDNPSGLVRFYTYYLTTYAISNDATGFVNDTTTYGCQVHVELAGVTQTYNVYIAGENAQNIQSLISEMNAQLSPEVNVQIVPEVDEQGFGIYGLKFTTVNGTGIYITDNIVGSPAADEPLFAELAVTVPSPTPALVSPLLMQLDRVSGLSNSAGYNDSGVAHTGFMGVSYNDVTTVGYVDWAVHNDRQRFQLSGNIAGTNYPAGTTYLSPYTIGMNELTVFYNRTFWMDNSVDYTEISEIPISSLTRVTTTATAVTSLPHNLTTGETVTFNSIAPFNITAVVTVVDYQTLTYTVANSGATSDPGTKSLEHSLVGHIGNKIKAISATVNNEYLFIQSSGRRYIPHELLHL